MPACSHMALAVSLSFWPRKLNGIHFHFLLLLGYLYFSDLKFPFRFYLLSSKWGGCSLAYQQQEIGLNGSGGWGEVGGQWMAWLCLPLNTTEQMRQHLHQKSSKPSFSSLLDLAWLSLFLKGRRETVSPGNFYLPKWNAFYTHVLQRRAWPAYRYVGMCSWFQLSINFQDLLFLDLYP